jgi:RNA polymerase sigma-70 factor, ECF subfamily
VRSHSRSKYSSASSLVARRFNDSIENNSTTSVLCMVQILMAEDARTTEPSFRDSTLQHLDGLYAYAMTLARNQAEAEDLVQETYLRAAQAFDRLRPDSNLKSWLFTILRNLRLNQVRNGPSKFRVVEMDGPGDGTREFEDKSSKDPLFLYLAKVKQTDVRKAIEELPAAYREIIVLREFEELSYHEIAQVLDCPSGTVMSRLNRARERLKDLLQHWSLATSEPV